MDLGSVQRYSGAGFPEKVGTRECSTVIRKEGGVPIGLERSNDVPAVVSTTKVSLSSWASVELQQNYGRSESDVVLFRGSRPSVRD